MVPIASKQPLILGTGRENQIGSAPGGSVFLAGSGDDAIRVGAGAQPVVVGMGVTPSALAWAAT